MKDFLKLLAYDVVLWATIITGLYLHLPYHYNLAVFVVPVMGILAVLVGLHFANMSTKPETEWTEQLLKTVDRLRSRPKYFVRYTVFSTTVEVLLVAATGHFFIATLYLIGTIAFFSGRQLIIEARDAHHNKNKPCEGLDCGTTNGEHSDLCKLQHQVAISGITKQMGSEYSDRRYAGYKGYAIDFSWTDEEKKAYLEGALARLQPSIASRLPYHLRASV